MFRSSPHRFQNFHHLAEGSTFPLISPLTYTLIPKSKLASKTLWKSSLAARYHSQESWQVGHSWHFQFTIPWPWRFFATTAQSSITLNEALLLTQSLMYLRQLLMPIISPKLLQLSPFFFHWYFLSSTFIWQLQKTPSHFITYRKSAFFLHSLWGRTNGRINTCNNGDMLPEVRGLFLHFPQNLF